MPQRSSGARLALLATLALAGCVSQGGSPTVMTYGYEQSVLSGRVSDMGDYNTVSGDGVGSCHLQPLPTVRILRQPAHGEMLVTTGRRVLHVRPGARVAYCDGRQFTSRIVQYRATSGYVGEDHLTYEVTFLDGTHDIYEKRLSVR